MKDEMEIHNIEIDGSEYRITNDPWTGDWAVEQMDDKYPQPLYVRTKQGAINFCLVESSLMKRSEAEYKIAPDRC
jgi:hypothetical protein